MGDGDRGRSTVGFEVELAFVAGCAGAGFGHSGEGFVGEGRRSVVDGLLESDYGLELDGLDCRCISTVLSVIWSQER